MATDWLPIDDAQRRRNWIFAGLACALAILGFTFGERVPVNGGLGWDGAIHARWAKDFHREVFVTGVDTYYVQRILPAGLVHYGLRAIGAPLTDANVMRAFGILSVALFTSMGFLWGKIAGHLRITNRGQWLGFVALFVNYVTLKHTFYVPVTTDVCAYAIGMAMLHCYLTRRTWPLVLLTLIGAFTWPLSLYVGTVLLAFPKSDVPGESASVRPLHVGLAFAVAVIAFWAIRYQGFRGPRGEAWLGNPEWWRAMRPLVNLSAAIAAGYLFLGAAPLLAAPQLWQFKSYSTLRRTAGVCALFLGVRYWQAAWSNGVAFMGVRDMLVNTGLTTAAKPGVFLVTHATYYGPFFVLALFLWRPVCNLLAGQGLGLVLVTGAGLALSLNSQSRYFINIFVMVLPFVLKATDAFDWRGPQCGLIVGLALLASKCWLTTNVGPFTGDPLEFPDQLMFMTHGPWVSNAMYLLQGVIALMAGFAMWRVCFADGVRVAKPTIARAAA